MYKCIYSANTVSVLFFKKKALFVSIEVEV